MPVPLNILQKLSSMQEILPGFAYAYSLFKIPRVEITYNLKTSSSTLKKAYFLAVLWIRIRSDPDRFLDADLRTDQTCLT